jgi:hypothetical protein
LFLCEPFSVSAFAEILRETIRGREPSRSGNAAAEGRDFKELTMFARIGTRHGRKALVVITLLSLASVGACSKSATEPEDPQTYDLQAHMATRGASASKGGGVVQAGWNLAQNKKAASMIGSAIGSAIDAFGKALTESARK